MKENLGNVMREKGTSKILGEKFEGKEGYYWV